MAIVTGHACFSGAKNGWNEYSFFLTTVPSLHPPVSERIGLIFLW